MKKYNNSHVGTGWSNESHEKVWLDRFGKNVESMHSIIGWVYNMSNL